MIYRFGIVRNRQLQSMSTSATTVAEDESDNPEGPGFLGATGNGPVKGDLNELAPPALDTGFHAWSAVAASLVTHIVLFGVIYSFGVFNAAYVSSGLGSSSTVSLVGSTSTVFIPALGILSGRLANKFGYSRMAIVGSCVLGIGLLSASFATNSLPLLILTQGALFGIGSSFIYFPALSLPAQWFVKWRGVATGIAVSGAGIGGMLFSLISNKLIDAVGLAWTLRTLAIVCTVLLLLVTPFFKPRVKAPNSNIDWSVVKDARFVCLLFSCFFANFGMFVSVDYLPLVAENLGFSPYQGASLASIYNACSSVGRIATGIAADRWLGPTNALVISSWITVATNFSWLAATSFPGLCSFAAVNGFVGGSFWGLMPVVVAEFFGADGRLVSIVGVLYTVLAGGNFGSPPLTGLVKDRAGIWWMIAYAGCLVLMSALFATMARGLHCKLILKKV